MIRSIEWKAIVSIPEFGRLIGSLMTRVVWITCFKERKHKKIL